MEERGVEATDIIQYRWIAATKILSIRYLNSKNLADNRLPSPSLHCMVEADLERRVELCTVTAETNNPTEYSAAFA